MILSIRCAATVTRPVLVASLFAVLAGCNQLEAAASPSPARPRTVSPIATVIITRPEGDTGDAPATDPALASRLADAASGDALWLRSLPREVPSGFGSMMLASFEGPAALARWQKANADALAAPQRLRTARVLAQAGEVAPRSSRSMYKVSYYSLTAPVEEFQAWVDGYLAKYLEAQRGAGILNSYAMYLEVQDGGRALLLLEYPDAQAEQAAEPRKEALSAALEASDPQYARYLPLKDTVRKTDSWTLAVPAG